MNNVLRMSLHQADILLNNGVAELAIPNTHFPQPAPCAVSMFSYRCTQKGYSSLIIINFISFKTYIHQRPKSMFKHGWYNIRE